MKNARPEHGPRMPDLPMFVACRDVRRALGGCSNSTINSLVADGTLPEPVRPRRNMVLFPREPLLQAFRRMGARSLNRSRSAGTRAAAHLHVLRRDAIGVFAVGQLARAQLPATGPPAIAMCAAHALG